MIDERRMRGLEAQVDALRTKEKDSDTRKTYDEVFDHAALLTIAQLITDGVLSTLDYPVSTGKEANVFHATGPDRRAKAVKIYRIATATFRNIAVYIEGDPRFKKVKRATRPTLLAWAQKEYKNLVRMGDAGVRVPSPERVLDNVLVMEYIGDETQPAPSLREVALEDPHAVFEDVVANMRGIRESELVHADLSEYNLLWWAGQVVVIDVGQAVTLDHPRAAEWFKRDVATPRRGRLLGDPRHQRFRALQESCVPDSRSVDWNSGQDASVDRGAHRGRGQCVGAHDRADWRIVRDGDRTGGGLHAPPRQRAQNRVSVPRAEAGRPQGVPNVLLTFPRATSRQDCYRRTGLPRRGPSCRSMFTCSKRATPRCGTSCAAKAPGSPR